MFGSIMSALGKSLLTLVTGHLPWDGQILPAFPASSYPFCKKMSRTHFVKGVTHLLAQPARKETGTMKAASWKLQASSSSTRTGMATVKTSMESRCLPAAGVGRSLACVQKDESRPTGSVRTQTTPGKAVPFLLCSSSKRKLNEEHWLLSCPFCAAISSRKRTREHQTWRHHLLLP